MNVQRVVLVSTLYFFYVALADCLHSVICISGTDIFHVLCEDSGCASGCEDCIYVGTFFGHLQDRMLICEKKSPLREKKSPLRNLRSRLLAAPTPSACIDPEGL